MISREEATSLFTRITRVAPSEAQIRRYAGADTVEQAIDQIITADGAQTARVTTFYQVFYNRLPEADGLDFWAGVVRNDPGFSDEALAQQFFSAGEFEARYGGLAPGDVVAALYRNVLGREPEPEGLGFWQGLVESGALSLFGLGFEFASAPETATRFAPHLDGYLETLAADRSAPATLFDVTPADQSKLSGGLSFTGDDGKVETQAIPLRLGGYDDGELVAQTATTTDLIRINQMRTDPRFANADGSGFTVAVLDTGIDLSHPFFGPDGNGDGIADRILVALDFTSETDGTAQDRNGHGSNVSSIVASSDARFPGVAPGANIIHLQVLTAEGSGSNAGIERALQWLVDNAAAYNVVAANLSLGPGDNINVEGPSSGGLNDEFAALRAAGVVTTVATGNDFFRFQAPGHSSLAVDPSVIGVSAVWDANEGEASWRSGAKDNTTAPDRVASFAQRSGELDSLFAPGPMSTGAGPGGGTVTQGGTSQAAPHVAGLVAVAQEIATSLLGRRLTPTEFEQVVRAGAVRIVDGDDEDDNVSNTGATFDRIDALGMAEAIAALGGGGEEPPAPPVPGGDDFAADPSTAGRFGFDLPSLGVIEIAGDLDWFAVDLVAGARYTFALGGSGGGALRDPLLVLRDAAGAAIAQDDDSGPGLASLIDIVAPATGRYYLEARGYDSAIGGYTLTGTETRSGIAGDLPADASTPSRLVSGAPVSSALEVEGDRDWHALDVVAGRVYEIALSGAGESPLYDPYLRTVAADGRVLDLNDDFEGLNSALRYAATTTERVFVEAAAFADGGAGTYRVIATDLGAGSSDIPGDPSSAARIEPGGTFTSALDRVGDTDWIGANLARGAVYEVALNGVNGAPQRLADPLLRVIDPLGNQIAFDDDGGGGLNALATFTATRDGLHFFAAESYGLAGLGAYEMALETVRGPGSDLPADSSTTGRLDLDQIVFSDLGDVGDRDWFALDLFAGQLAVVELYGVGDGALDDPLLRVRDAGGTVLAENDDFDGLDSLVFFVAPSTGRYYVEAAAYADFGTGTYALSATETFL